MDNKSLIETILSYGYEEILFADIKNTSFFIIQNDFDNIYQKLSWTHYILNISKNKTLHYSLINPYTIVYIPKVVIYFQNIQNEIKPKKDYISKKGQSLKEIFANEDYFKELKTINSQLIESILNCKSLLTRNEKDFYLIYNDYSAFEIKSGIKNTIKKLPEEFINAKDWKFVNQFEYIDKPIIKTKNLTVKEVLNTPGYQEALEEFLKTKDIKNFPFKVTRPFWNKSSSVVFGKDHIYDIYNNRISSTSVAPFMEDIKINDFQFVDYQG